MHKKIEERHKKITHISNTIWKIYKTFLENQDMNEYLQAWTELLETYQNRENEEFFAFGKCLFISWDETIRKFAEIFREIKQEEKNGEKE